MTVQKAVDIFSLILDKTGSPNLLTAEVIDYINMAMNEYLNRLFPDNQGGVVNEEFDANVIANIRELIYQVTVDSNGSGLILYNTLAAALVAESGDSWIQPLRILRFSKSGTYIRYAKEDNIGAYENNSFKAPNATNMYYVATHWGWQLYPKAYTLGINASVVTAPKVLTTADLPFSAPFEDYAMYNIISIALKMAGVGVRDEELIQDVRLAGNQIQQ